MLTSVHLLTGAAIGKLTGNWWSAILLSYAFHHIFDSIPHYNPQPVKGYLEGHLGGADKRDLILKSLEPALGIAATLYLIFSNPLDLRSSMVLGAVFGWLPDLFVFLEWKFKKRFARFFTRIEKHFHQHTSFLPGMLSQIFIMALAIFVLIN